MNVQQLHAAQMAAADKGPGPDVHAHLTAPKGTAVEPRALTGSGDVSPSDAYDPSTVSVPDVMDWVALHPDMAAGVLEAERSGRGRVGIVRPLEAQLEGDS